MSSRDQLCPRLDVTMPTPPPPSAHPSPLLHHPSDLFLMCYLVTYLQAATFIIINHIQLCYNLVQVCLQQTQKHWTKVGKLVPRRRTQRG
jgi:hypothetical protein